MGKSPRQWYLQVGGVCGENKFVRCNGLVVVLSGGLNLMKFMIYAEPVLAVMASLVGLTIGSGKRAFEGGEVV